MKIGSVPKGFRPLADLAKKQGWKVESSSNSHLQWLSPLGDTIVSPSTPSDYRGMKNFTSSLKRAGMLVTKHELDGHVRLENKIAKRVLTLDKEWVGERFAGEVKRKGTLPTESEVEAWLWILAAVQEIGPRYDQDAIEESVLHSIPLKCSCGHVSTSGADLGVHCYDSDRMASRYGHRLVFSDESFGAMPDSSPPADGTVLCPECEFWAYKSQVDRIDKHLKKKHRHLELCGACFDFIPSGTIDAHYDEDCIVVAEANEAEPDFLDEVPTTEAEPLLDDPSTADDVKSEQASAEALMAAIKNGKVDASAITAAIIEVADAYSDVKVAFLRLGVTMGKVLSVFEGLNEVENLPPDE